MIFSGAPPKGCKTKTLVLLIRVRGQRWYHASCFGQRSHYKPDGSCFHTDELLASAQPDKRHLIKVQPWGDGRRP